ncbi:MAG: hypothetical protein JSR72_07385 [Proteobacteria bacterium]|nr:hypothetical protein [Pseudomonadota bacterium]
MRAMLAGFLVAGLLPGAAQACSCAPNPTAASIRQSASAVFTGVALRSRRVSPGEAVTTFRITESFKGPAAGATVRVQHPDGSSASCGIRFATGETHTLAASAATPQRPLSANLCSVWMFLPHVGLSEKLIGELRALRGQP